MDPVELINLANKTDMQEIRNKLEKRLQKWQEITNDPWRCSPHNVLQDKGQYKNNPQCLPLGI